VCYRNSSGVRDSKLSLWRRLGAFTLVEMLVVIAIIGILAGILMPAFLMARERTRQTNCKNQIHQFAIAVEIYRTHFQESYPPWLSALYPNYVPNSRIYICPSDDSKGLEGSVPAWFAEQKTSLYLETDDTKVRDQQLPTAPGAFGQYERDTKQARNTAVEACSYIYEFCSAPCSWWYGNTTGGGYGGDFSTNQNIADYKWADFDNNGFVSWREAKRTEEKGLEYNQDSSNPGPRVYKGPDKYKWAYDGHVPMLRCFQHNTRGRSLDDGTAINVACENKNIYNSRIFGNDWKEAAGWKQSAK